MHKKRVLKILMQLNEQKVVTSESLASKLQVSSKTVRTQIKELQPLLNKEGAHLYSKINSGYLLEVTNQAKYDSFKERLRQQSDIPTDAPERMERIMEIFLESDGKYIKLDDLADKLFISKSKLTAELSEVRDKLIKHNLTIENKPHYGMRLVGNEFDIRLSMAVQMMNNLDDKVSQDSISKIGRCITEALRDSTLKINEAAYQNLFIHVYIIFRRIQKGHFLPKNLKLEAIDQEQVGYQEAKKIIELLEKEYKVKVPDAEIDCLAIHLLGKQIFQGESKVSNLVIMSEVNNVVTEMLDAVYQNFQMNFYENVELRMSLAMHLIPMMVRLRYGLNFSNPLREEIRSHYQFAYMLAVAACEVLVKQFHKDVSDDEISYIATHFGLALERMKKIVKKNVLIICATGGGSARLLVWKFKEEFGHYLNRIDTSEVSKLQRMDISAYDYVISTVPILFNINRPILEIQSFLDENDKRAVRNLLDKPRDFSVVNFFSPELFMPNMVAANREEVIRQMVDRIKAVKEIPHDFYDAVMKREALAATGFGNKVAIPHPNQAMADKTFVCVAILKKPISWGKRKAQFIFLFSMKKPVDDNIQYFTKVMSKLLFSEECINEIIRKPNYQDLMELLRNFEKES